MTGPTTAVPGVPGKALLGLKLTHTEPGGASALAEHSPLPRCIDHRQKSLPACEETRYSKRDTQRTTCQRKGDRLPPAPPGPPAAPGHCSAPQRGMPRHGPGRAGGQLARPFFRALTPRDACTGVRWVKLLHGAREPRREQQAPAPAAAGGNTRSAACRG